MRRVFPLVFYAEEKRIIMQDHSVEGYGSLDVFGGERFNFEQTK